MENWEITDVKNFMNKMLLSEKFDNFLLEEGDLHGSMRIHFDGHLENGYFSSEELEERMSQGDCVHYGEIRHIILEAIKGKNTPDFFRFVYKADNELVKIIAEDSGTPASNISGLFMNVTFRGGSLNVVDGTAMKVFSLDKSVDKSWDKCIQKFLHNNEFNWNII